MRRSENLGIENIGIEFKQRYLVIWIISQNRIPSLSSQEYNSYMTNKKRVILLAITICLQIHRLIKLRRTISSQAKLIGILKGLDLVCIQDLKAKISSGVYKIGDLVLCHGGISSSEPMDSLLSPTKPVAFSELILEKIFQLGDRTNTVRRKIRKLHSSFLNLQSFGDKINIYETLNTQFIPIMYRKKIKTYKEKIMNFGWFLKLFIQGPTRTVSSIYTESYIPDNYYTVVLGNIQSSKTGQIFMKNPTAIAPTKQAIIGNFISKMGNNWIFFYCLCALTLLTMFFMSKYSIQAPSVRNLFKEGSPKSTFDRLEKILVRSKICKCGSNMSSHIRVPCGHLNICQECEKKQNNKSSRKECEDCKKTVRRSVQVFPC